MFSLFILPSQFFLPYLWTESTQGIPPRIVDTDSWFSAAAIFYYAIACEGLNCWGGRRNRLCCCWMKSTVLLVLLVGEVEVDLKIWVELTVESFKIRVCSGYFARPAVHFLSMEYNIHTHYICKKVNNQIQTMRSRRDKSRPLNHSPTHSNSPDPHPNRYRNKGVVCPIRQLILAFS